MKRQLIIFTTTVLTLAACTNDENLNMSDGQVAIRLSSSLATYAATNIQSTAFDVGESVDVFITEDAQTPTTTYQQPLTYTTGMSGAMTPPTGEQPYFPTSGNGVYIQAYYPAGTVTDMSASEVTFTVASDQSTDANYKASDLMYGTAANPVSRTSTSIPVTFSHLLSKVTVNLTAGDGTPNLTDATVSLVNIRLDAKLTPSDGSVTDGTGTQTESVKVTTDTVGSAIIPIQTVASGKFIQVSLSTGIELYYELPLSATFQSGKVYTYNIKVNLTGLEVTSNITDWTTDDNYPGDDDGVAVIELPDYTYDQETRTYTVYNAEGLLAWNKAASSDPSISCTLAADINLRGIAYEWLLVGMFAVDYYTGTFEGGGHTITGLTINKSEASCVGLIGYLDSSGKVQNVTLKDMEVSGYSSVGSVVGYNLGTVTNCSASGSVSGNGNSVGGVVGYNYGSVIACSASSIVSGDNQFVGGVVGYNQVNCIVTACYASGSVSGSEYVGGVVGYNDFAVTACYHALGSVSGSEYVGGVVGWSHGSYSSVTACYWNCDHESKGIGGGTDNTIEVDGADVDWSDAVTGMNNALLGMNNAISSSGWQYELTGTYPTLKKN